MSGRPCNPGSDLRQLWQALLGNTPFPQCGTPEQQDSDEAPESARANDHAQPEQIRRDGRRTDR